jgi:hypothetical protein
MDPMFVLPNKKIWVLVGVPVKNLSHHAYAPSVVCCCLHIVTFTFCCFRHYWHLHWGCFLLSFGDWTVQRQIILCISFDQYKWCGAMQYALHACFPPSSSHLQANCPKLATYGWNYSNTAHIINIFIVEKQETALAGI